MELSVHGFASPALIEKINQILNRISSGETVTESHIALPNVAITGLDFRASTLTYITAEGTRLQSCNLDNANLTGMDYSDGEIKHSSFVSAKFIKSSIYSCILECVNFTSCNFDRSEITDVVFNKVSFEHASLIGASFDNCNLRGVNFEMAIFGGTHFFGCLLDEKIKDFPGVVLKAALHFGGQRRQTDTN